MPLPSRPRTDKEEIDDGVSISYQADDYDDAR